MRKLLTVGQVSKVLGVSAMTVRRWSTSGKIRVLYNEQGQRRYFNDDVLDLANQEQSISSKILKLFENQESLSALDIFTQLALDTKQRRKLERAIADLASRGVLLAIGKQSTPGRFATLYQLSDKMLEC